jgi:hypothetical protein
MINYPNLAALLLERHIIVTQVFSAVLVSSLSVTSDNLLLFIFDYVSHAETIQFFFERHFCGSSKDTFIMSCICCDTN